MTRNEVLIIYKLNWCWFHGKIGTNFGAIPENPLVRLYITKRSILSFIITKKSWSFFIPVMPLLLVSRSALTQHSHIHNLLTPTICSHKDAKKNPREKPKNKIKYWNCTNSFSEIQDPSKSCEDTASLWTNWESHSDFEEKCVSKWKLVSMFWFRISSVLHNFSFDSHRNFSFVRIFDFCVYDFEYSIFWFCMFDSIFIEIIGC